MSLFDTEIKRGLASGSIVIEPFKEEHLGSNSYDVTLGPYIAVYKQPWWSKVLDKLGIYTWSLDTKKSTPVKTFRIPESGILLKPGQLYLAHTNEIAGTTRDYIPHLTGRSSCGRLGLSVHVTAGFGDVGFCRQWTLELKVVHPLRVYPNDRIAQVYFEKGVGELERPYKGRYANQEGPTASRFHRG